MTTASTEKRFLDSTVAAYASLGVRMVVTFASRMVLARLLLPETWGVYELAFRLVMVAGAVRDLGLGYHLMRDERRPYGTVFAATAVSGTLVALGLALAAPWFGVLEPDLPAVLRVMALWVLLDGLAVAPRAFFDRELAIGRLVVPEILRGLTTAVVAIALALLGKGVWSLVVGELAAAALFAALAWRRAAGRMPLEVQPRLLPDLLRRSSPLFGIWLLLILVTYVDVFIVRAFTGTATVAFYAKAYELSFLVAGIMAPRSLLPALVAYRDDAERTLSVFRLSTVFLMTFQVLAGYFLFWNAEKAIAILYGEEWAPAAALLRVLCFVPFLDVFNKIAGEVLKAREEDRRWIIIVALNLVSLVGFGIFLTSRYGAPGMAAANFLLLGNLLMARRMAQIFAGGVSRLLRDLVSVYLLPLPLFGLVAALTEPASWLRFGLGIVAAVLALGAQAHLHADAFRSFWHAPAQPSARA